MPVDVGGLDPFTVSLRDYIDGAHAMHESAHAREREALAVSLEKHDKYSDTVVESHFKEHDIAHEAVKVAFANAQREVEEFKKTHYFTHKQQAEAVKVALEAVDKTANIHALFHDKEHTAHELIHQREREVAALARVELANRLQELADQRAQLREQNATFMSRNEIVSLIDRVSQVQETQQKSADNAHARMDTVTRERTDLLQGQIDKLNLQAAAGYGASQRTVYLVGLGLTFITIIITIITLYLANKK